VGRWPGLGNGHALLLAAGELERRCSKRDSKPTNRANSVAQAWLGRSAAP